MDPVTFLLDTENEARYLIDMLYKTTAYIYHHPAEGLPGHRVLVYDGSKEEFKLISDKLDLEKSVTPTGIVYTKTARGAYK